MENSGSEDSGSSQLPESLQQSINEVWIPNDGDSDQGCTDICLEKGKHTDTIFTWFGKSPTSTGESPYYLEMRKNTINTWRRIT